MPEQCRVPDDNEPRLAAADESLLCLLPRPRNLKAKNCTAQPFGFSLFFCRKGLFRPEPRYFSVIWKSGPTKNICSAAPLEKKEKTALRNNLWVSSQGALAWAKQIGAPEGKITPLASLIWPSAQPVLPSPGEIFFGYQKIFHKNTT